MVPNRNFPCIPARAIKELARVVEIVDGDDIIVTLYGRREEVHYIGTDTPDASDKAYEAESTVENRQLVGGRTVTLVRDGANRDEYGRLRRYIFAGETFVNNELVAKGYAWANEPPPDYACADTLLLAEQSAIDLSLGMWAQINK
jgi:endonuclease YncB( thermonuclease family)